MAQLWLLHWRLEWNWGEAPHQVWCAMYANKMVDTTWYNTSGDIWSAQVSPIPNRTQMGLSKNWVPNFSTASSSFSLIYISCAFSCFFFHLGDISNGNPNHPNWNPYCPCLHPIKNTRSSHRLMQPGLFSIAVSTFARGTWALDLWGVLDTYRF